MNRGVMLAAVWGIWAVYNLYVYLLYRGDKQKAKRGEWRVPERKLLLCAWLMGGVGAYLSMKRYRHKTKHIQFILTGLPSAVLNIAVMAGISYWILFRM